MSGYSVEIFDTEVYKMPDKKGRYWLQKETRLLAEGEYRDYKFYIISLGRNPCAYIEVPVTHPLYRTQWLEWDSEVFDEINCNGGITFSGELENIGAGHWLLGWDYGHCWDYILYSGGDVNRGTHHTVESMLSDIKRALKDLERLE